MLLEWFNDIVRWMKSDDGWTVLTGAVIPFVAIVAGGIVAGLIARGAIKRLMTQQDREAKASAVAALIASGRKAAAWSSLTAQEKEHVEHQTSEAEVRVRLLPVMGASLAADWAAHHISTMKKNSANYSFQADQDLVDLTDGLIAWQSRPVRAKKLFAADLAAWRYDAGLPEDDLARKQREWTEQQQAESPFATSILNTETPRAS